MTNLTELFGAPIDVVTRADLIEAGHLVAVPREAANESGWRWPVALTAAAWADCVSWSEAEEARHGGYGQSESGRLWDVLFLAFQAVRRANPGIRRVPFEVRRIAPAGPVGRATSARLAVFCGPGDAGEPVITIMQANED